MNLVFVINLCDLVARILCMIEMAIHPYIDLKINYKIAVIMTKLPHNTKIPAYK